MSDGRFGLLGKGVVDALVNVVYLGPLVVSEDVVTAIVLAVSVEGVVSIDFMDLGVSERLVVAGVFVEGISWEVSIVLLVVTVISVVPGDLEVSVGLMVPIL